MYMLYYLHRDVPGDCLHNSVGCMEPLTDFGLVGGFILLCYTSPGRALVSLLLVIDGRLLPRLATPLMLYSKSRVL